MIQPKSAQCSACTMTEWVLPGDANAFGTFFGGVILSWVDLCAVIAAQRHTSCTAVTAVIDNLWFEAPIHIGQVARIEARVTATFRTSFETEVSVYGEDPTTSKIWRCVHAFLTFVALDNQKHPTQVPPLLIETEEDQKRQHDAEERRSLRLARQKREMRT